jgi:biotin transport system substrate-specific component
LGQTGGYLIGFLVAAWAMGSLAERGWDRSLWRAVVAMTLGAIILFVPGVAWLSHWVGWEKAVAAGLTPFIYGDVLKLALAAATLPLARRLAQRRAG